MTVEAIYHLHCFLANLVETFISGSKKQSLQLMEKSYQVLVMQHMENDLMKTERKKCRS